MPFPIASSEIEKTEVKSGFIFPPTFKARMTCENGGDVDIAGEEWSLFPFLDASDRKRLARTCNDILRETIQMKGWDGFPSDAFAIGSNGFGDCIYLLPERDGEKVLGETIFRFDHETGESEPIAPSIRDCK